MHLTRAHVYTVRLFLSLQYCTKESCKEPPAQDNLQPDVVVCMCLLPSQGVGGHEVAWRSCTEHQKRFSKIYLTCLCFDNVAAITMMFYAMSCTVLPAAETVVTAGMGRAVFCHHAACRSPTAILYCVTQPWVWGQQQGYCCTGTLMWEDMQSWPLSHVT